MRSKKNSTSIAHQMMKYLLSERHFIRTTTRMEVLMVEYEAALKEEETILDAEARPVGPGRKKWV